jgi:hypothetical protein
MIHFARIVLPELARGAPLTGGASTEGPLDPTGEEDAAPEPEPVDTDAETPTDSEPDVTPTSASASGPTTERSSEPDSSADRVRSTWGDDSSATDGGRPQR